MNLTFLYVAVGVVLNVAVFAFWKPWLSGYTAEKSKTFARKEDLDTILAEVRAVTITQKEIEAKLTSQQWDRQMRWNQKRDIYGDLLTSSQDLGQAFGEMPATLKMRADPRPEFKAEGEKNLSNCLIRIRNANPNFSKVMMLALIFTSPECCETLRAFAKDRTTIA